MTVSKWLKADHALGVAVGATALTLAALVIGAGQFITGKNIEAANWVMAAGGLGLIVFSSVQLYREARREDERLAAARAKLKPAAWLARRMCEQGVIESDSKYMNQWLSRWYTSVRVRMEGGGPPDPINVLQDLMRETVTLAAEAGEEEVKAADTAFSGFIVAANILNDLTPLLGATDDAAYRAGIPRARKAANHLADAAHALATIAPRGAEEPVLIANPKFSDER